MEAFKPLSILPHASVLANVEFFESVERVRVRFHGGKLPLELRNKVEFPRAARAVAALEVHLGQRLLLARQGDAVGPDTMHAGISAGENAGARGHADRVLDPALPEHNAGPGQ